MLSYNTVTEATRNLADLVLSEGVERSSRGFKYRELQNVSWEVTRPSYLVTALPSRKAHPFQLLAETLWVLAGRADLDFLLPYIPSAKDYSDDGITWPGAYGPRICSALPSIISMLKKDRDTRRAYIPINYPEDLSRLEHSKDIPCNVGIHFYMNGDGLVLARFCRSNDLIFGYAINHFEFSVLAQLVANTLGVKFVRYINHVSSLHVYSDKYEQALAMANDPVVEASCPTNVDLYDAQVGERGAVYRLACTVARANNLSGRELVDFYHENHKDCYEDSSFLETAYELLFARRLCQDNTAESRECLGFSKSAYYDIGCMGSDGRSDLVEHCFRFLANKYPDLWEDSL